MNSKDLAVIQKVIGGLRDDLTVIGSSVDEVVRQQSKQSMLYLFYIYTAVYEAAKRIGELEEFCNAGRK